jgi:hypothetical protein
MTIAPSTGAPSWSTTVPVTENDGGSPVALLDAFDVLDEDEADDEDALAPPVACWWSPHEAAPVAAPTNSAPASAPLNA